jgi:hypothetical protein
MRVLVDELHTEVFTFDEDAFLLLVHKVSGILIEHADPWVTVVKGEDVEVAEAVTAPTRDPGEVRRVQCS